MKKTVLRVTVDFYSFNEEYEVIDLEVETKRFADMVGVKPNQVYIASKSKIKEQ